MEKLNRAIGQSLFKASWNSWQTLIKINRKLTHYLGSWMWLSLLLIIFVIGLSLALHTQTKQLHALQNAVKKAQQIPKASKQENDEWIDDDQTRLQSFAAQLLPKKMLDETLRSLLQLAKEQNIMLKRADYQIQNDSDGQFTRYRIRWNIQGRAFTIQTFLADALSRHSNLAIEQIQFKRESQNSNIDAQIQAVLFMQASSESQAL